MNAKQTILAIVAVIISSLLVAIPVSLAYGKQSNSLNNIIKVERSEKQQLRLEVKSIEKQKEETEKRLTEQLQQQTQENEKLRKDLEAKAESKRLAAAVTTPAQDVAGVSVSTNCEDYRGLVSQYNWDVNTALAIMRAESGCNPRAFNAHNSDGSNDGGLFQVNSIHVRSGLIGDQERFDPASNVRAAYVIYQGSHWRAWSVYNSGKYLRY